MTKSIWEDFRFNKGDDTPYAAGTFINVPQYSSFKDGFLGQFTDAGSPAHTLTAEELKLAAKKLSGQGTPLLLEEYALCPYCSERLTMRRDTLNHTIEIFHDGYENISLTVPSLALIVDDKKVLVPIVNWCGFIHEDDK